MQTAAQPRLRGPASEIQEYGTSGQPALRLRHVAPVVEALNQILADALTLRDLYKKHHWQAAHEILIGRVRDGAKLATDHGDDGTNDLLISGVLRTNEMQVWFLSEHLRSASERSASQQIAP